MTRQSGTSPVDGPRHSASWYDQSAELVEIRTGDRLFVPCDGGPSTTRLVRFPPPLEISERGGIYVLVDDGPRYEWTYRFVPDQEIDRDVVN